jgi:tetratricopeptide (TPR) repeat protein
MQPGWLAVMLAAAVLGAPRVQAQVEGTIIKKADKREVVGSIVWKSRQRVYEITAKNVTTTLGLDEVARVKIKAPPPELAAAIQQVRGGKPALAIPALKDIFDKYEMLEYDIVAGRSLADAYVKNGQPKDALAVCDKLARENPDIFSDPGLAGPYTEALLALDQVGKLKEVLSNIITKGSRESAAVALIRRGDLEKKRGNFKEALIDGYLRTIVLYEDVKGAQPEALYNASLCFDQLSQGPYAERMRRKLQQTYPQDPYAKKVAAGK